MKLLLASIAAMAISAPMINSASQFVAGIGLMIGALGLLGFVTVALQ